MRKQRIAYLFLLPGIILLTVFLILPLITMIWPTFYNGQLNIDAYFNFFKSGFNTAILWRTIKIALFATLWSAILGLPTAYYISQTTKKWRSLLLALILFPLLTNSVVRSFAWINILGTNGIINQILLAIGLIQSPLKLLYTEFAMIIGSIYLFLPLMITSLVAVLENLDNDLMEAAQTLGANPLTAFMKVVLPLSLPGIIVGSILVFTGTFTAYTTPQLLGGNQNMVMATFLYQQAMTLGNWESASVVALIMIATTVIITQLFNAIANRIDRRGGTMHA